MKKLLLLTMFATPFYGAFADDIQNAMVVTMKDGTTVTYLLRESPELTFDGNDLSVTTLKYTSQHSLDDVQRYGFASVEDDAVRTITTDGTITRDGDIVSVTTKSGSKVSLFNASGVLVKSVVADKYGNAVLSLSSLAQGVYLLNVNNTTTKITKR